MKICGYCVSWKHAPPGQLLSTLHYRFTLLLNNKSAPRRLVHQRKQARHWYHYTDTRYRLATAGAFDLFFSIWRVSSNALPTVISTGEAGEGERPSSGRKRWNKYVRRFIEPCGDLLYFFLLPFLSLFFIFLFFFCFRVSHDSTRARDQCATRNARDTRVETLERTWADRPITRSATNRFLHAVLADVQHAVLHSMASETRWMNLSILLLLLLYAESLSSH